MLTRTHGLVSLLLALMGALALPAIAAAADTRAPSTPQNLRVTATTSSSLSIAWSASSDNVGVTGYRVFRNGTLVETTTSRSTTLTGLACGTSYIVFVSAKDAAGNKSLPAAVMPKTGACAPATPPCPTPATVLGLLLEHKIQYGCSWPDGWAARQAVQSMRSVLDARRVKLETWRGRKWHAEAIGELDAATQATGAWSSAGALLPNKAGVTALSHLHRAIRVMHYHNAELFTVSRAEKWAVTATVWYIVASEYNRHFKAAHTNAWDMKAARTAIQRGDVDFFASNTYRAAGRYIKAFRRLNQLF